MTELAFIDGKFVPLKQAKISVMDLSVQRGFAIAEPFRSYNGVPFGMSQHLARLKSSARLLGIQPIPQASFVARKVHEGLARIGSDCAIKVIVTGGDSNFLIPSSKSRLVILFMSFPPFPAKMHERGIRIKSFIHERPYPIAKSTEYLTAVVEYRRAARAGFNEVLFLDRARNILECSTSNFAIIKGRKMITAKEGVLHGVTLQFIMKLARRAGLVVERRKVKYKELYHADEAFISSMNRQVLSVVKVDNIKIGTGRVGPYSKKLLKLFREFAGDTKGK